MYILCVNPGSTSTKIAVYQDEKNLMELNVQHSPEDLAHFAKATDQFEYRKNLVEQELKKQKMDFPFNAVIGRGGLTHPLKGGIYNVNRQMLDDVMNSPHQHACDLGCVIAYAIAKDIPGCKCYIADPGIVDELVEYQHITGIPEIRRITIWHALNQKAAARRYAKSIGKTYEDLRLVICHMGGGISIAAHDHGLAIDANNALDGEGPFTPNRAGTLPSHDLIKLCFSGKYDEAQLLKIVSGEAGLKAHLGTDNFLEILHRIEAGDEHAKLVVDAMIFHIAKAIASEGAVLCGRPDAIILTGGMVHSKYLVEELTKRIGWMAPEVISYAGEGENSALAASALDALTGAREVLEYE